MAQITAAVTAAAAAAVVSFRYFPPGREIPGLNFPARRLPRKYCRLNRTMNADFPPPGKICMHLNAVFLRRRKVRVHSSIQTIVPANPPWTVTIFLCADRHVTWEKYSFLHSLAGCTAGSRWRPEAETGIPAVHPNSECRKVVLPCTTNGSDYCSCCAAVMQLQLQLLLVSDISRLGGKYRV